VSRGPFAARLRSGGPVVLDGAMGTALMEKGMPPGQCPEALNLSHPEWIVAVHRAYLEAGADCIATACPLCQLNLDLRQRDTEKLAQEHFGLPVFYFTQLLGLALGLSARKLAIHENISDSLDFLHEKGVI